MFSFAFHRCEIGMAKKITTTELRKRAENYKSAVKSGEFVIGDARFARHNLNLGKRVLEGLVGRQRNKTPKQTAAADSYRKFLDISKVSSRVYDGAPDWAMFSTDWISGFAFNGQGVKQGGIAIFYFGYLLRYGYWNGKGCLVMNKAYRTYIQSQIGITSNTHYLYMQWLVKWGMFKKPVVFGLNTYYELNQEVITVVNENRIKRVGKEGGTGFKADVTYEETVEFLKTKVA